jgi:hypothetical protein
MRPHTCFTSFNTMTHSICRSWSSWYWITHLFAAWFCHHPNKITTFLRVEPHTLSTVLIHTLRNTTYYPFRFLWCLHHKYNNIARHYPSLRAHGNTIPKPHPPCSNFNIYADGSGLPKVKKLKPNYTLHVQTSKANPKELSNDIHSELQSPRCQRIGRSRSCQMAPQDDSFTCRGIVPHELLAKLTYSS